MYVNLGLKIRNMDSYINANLRLSANQSVAGKTHWISPSNLALIKYWGKYGRQLPCNPSISFTLDTAVTETMLQYKSRTTTAESIELDFQFDGKPNEPFRAKLLKFLDSIKDIFPFIAQLHFDIQSSNSFPHSAGIASSASSMSALAICLCTIERTLFGTLSEEKDFYKKASYIARLGSGSACRSVYPTMAVWGETPEVADSSNLFAVPYEAQLHPIFHDFKDDILIVSKGEKSVSSTAGHGLMEGNIFAENRYAQARTRFANLQVALQKGDLEAFGQITENEALTLHALMMTSEPSYILMRPNTLAQIELLRAFRKDTGHPVYFSLDAGPNLHLLYPANIASPVRDFIQSELLPLCEDNKMIADQVGKGPRAVVYK